MTIGHKRQLIKLYGTAAEIFEDALIPFFSKIQGYLEKKLKEGDVQLHLVISESCGQLVHSLFKKKESIEELLQ